MFQKIRIIMFFAIMATMMSPAMAQKSSKVVKDTIYEGQVKLEIERVKTDVKALEATIDSLEKVRKQPENKASTDTADLYRHAIIRLYGPLNAKKDTVTQLTKLLKQVKQNGGKIIKTSTAKANSAPVTATTTAVVDTAKKQNVVTKVDSTLKKSATTTAKLDSITKKGVTPTNKGATTTVKKVEPKKVETTTASGKKMKDDWDTKPQTSKKDSTTKVVIQKPDSLTAKETTATVDTTTTAGKLLAKTTSNPVAKKPGKGNDGPATSKLMGKLEEFRLEE